MRLRPLNSGDYHALQRFCCTGETGDHHEALVEKQVKKLAGYVSERDCFAHALVDDGDNVRAVLAHEIDRDWQPPVIHLRILAVSLDLQGPPAQRLGQALLRAVLGQLAQAHSGWRVMWMTHNENERAKHISTKFGAAQIEGHELEARLTEDQQLPIDDDYVVFELTL